MADKLYFDIETNGLIRELKVCHCVAITDMNTDEDFYYGPPVPQTSKYWTPLLGSPKGTVEEAIDRLSDKGDPDFLTVAHNGCGYDYIAMEHLYPNYVRPKKAWDSFVAAKIIWPYDVLAGPDFARVKKGTMPASLAKRHSLKAWGYRLGDLKDEYMGDDEKYPHEHQAKERYEKRWDEWNPALASYMMQDNSPGVKLWKLIERRAGWVDPEKVDLVTPEFVFEYEHEVASIIAQQELDGVNFDRDKAEALVAELENHKSRINKELVQTFGSWWQAGKVTNPATDRQMKLTEYPDVTFKRFSEKTGKELAPYVGPPLQSYYTDAPYTPVERVTFSPSSRDHLGQRLQVLYGWKPKKFGAMGKPTVDEGTLEEIPEAVIPKEIRELILDFFVVNKTLGMLAKGSKAWLNMLDKEPDGRLHGRVDPNGAITTRALHSNPNLGQCPAVRKEKVVIEGKKTEQILYGLKGRYGYECRELFIADRGWEQTGVDASSLELIDLGHYLQKYDNGAFSERVCDPSRDPHAEHAEITNLTRGDTKTATYLYVYGGSAYKLSLDLKIEEADDLVDLLSYRGLPMLMRSLAKRFDQDFVDKLDDNQKARIAKARKIIVAFEAGITGIKDLKDDVTAAAARGWLRGMDGRKLYVRKAFAALNTLLQSAGAMSCKVWIMLVHRKLKAAGLKHGVDYKQVLWVHDELQFTHRPGLGPQIKAIAEEAMREAGEILGLRGTYRTDGKTGANWAECH